MKKPLVIYPFLLAAFPILFLFTYNLGEVSFSEIVIPLLTSLVATGLIFMVLKFTLKDSNKSSLITSTLSVLFFSFGHAHGLINTRQAFFLAEIIIPLIMVLLTTFFLYLFLKRIVKEKKKRVLILFGFLVIPLPIILFLRGSIFNFILRSDLLVVFFKFLKTYEFLSLVGIAVLLFVSYKTIKSKNSFDNLTKCFNYVLVILVLFSLLQAGIYYISTGSIWTGIDENIQEEKVLPILVDNSPDIYYIILDGYGRADKLKEVYGYDNGGFVEMLTDKGFYVATNGRSNYASTPFSIASSLNMKYVNFLSEELGNDSRDGRVIHQMVENNEVVNFLKARGYRFVHISSGLDPTTHNENADIEYNYNPFNFNEFDRVLIETTWLKAVALSLFYEQESKRILYNFEEIGKVPLVEEPTFLFAHFMSPHPPYLFDQQGNFVPSKMGYRLEGEVWLQKQAYINQLIFINKKTEELIDKILSQSEVPPIIIVQSDHGTKASADHPTESLLKERVANLNAYYLPNGGNEKLYNSITPVNSFRLIFDFYFNSTYGLLEDKSYFPNSGNYYGLEFVRIPEEDSIVWEQLKKS
jgi:hypothetical protein